MSLTFEEMFPIDGDYSDRANELGDVIPVRLVHAWNWDLLMNQAVIYAFVKYWDSEGPSQLDMLRESFGEDSWMRGRFRIYKGLEICYNRIQNDPDVFFRKDMVRSVEQDYMVSKTLDFVWKHRHFMWN